MASKIDVSALTINTDEAREIGKAIMEKVLVVGKLAQYHEIQTGIEYDTQIPFVGTLGMVGKAITGCGTPGSANSIPLTEKKWEPKRIGDRLEHCETDLNALLKIFQNRKRTTPEFYNQIDSEAMGVVIARAETALEQMLERLAWFGDTAADIDANGGVYSDALAADMPYYTPLNGLWKQIFAEIPNGNKYHVNVDVNEGASYADQKLGPDDLDDGYARDLFKQMINKRDSRFKQAVEMGVDQVIHATSALVENYVNWLEDKSLAFTLDRAEDGTLASIKYRNTTIIARYDWDVHIAKQDDGTVINHPHRALLTTKENIPFGTPSEEELMNIKSFYDDYHEVNVIRFVDLFDVKFLENYMAVAAY